MEAAFVRNLRDGRLIANAPLQFIRIPCVGEGVQIVNAVWIVNSVVHAWRSPNEPLCEIRVVPPTRTEDLPIERSIHE